MFFDIASNYKALLLFHVPFFTYISVYIHVFINIVDIDVDVEI